MKIELCHFFFSDFPAHVLFKPEMLQHKEDYLWPSMVAKDLAALFTNFFFVFFTDAVCLRNVSHELGACVVGIWIKVFKEESNLQGSKG